MTVSTAVRISAWTCSSRPVTTAATSLPFEVAQAVAASVSSVMSADGKLRPSAMTTAWPMSGLAALSEPSIADGAMYLPPLVLTRSFLRSVILQEAVGVELADVPGREPAVLERASRAVCSGRWW